MRVKKLAFFSGLLCILKKLFISLQYQELKNKIHFKAI